MIGPLRKRERAPLQLMDVMANVTLEDITVDVIGGEWPTTLRKNKHMLVSICNVSKWVVETCDQFCYLGSTISDTGGNIKEIDPVG